MIDWYPGHMVTAKKDAAAAMRKCDVVIEVLDARVPVSSVNPVIEKLRRDHQRPALKLLNKVDLADPKRTEAVLRDYNAQPGTRAIAICAKKASDAARIPKEARALLPQKKAMRLMILGIPNVGKSTLLNTLLKRSVAKVGDEPAITKQHAQHELTKDMWLVDTPGMMWPGIDQALAWKLAATHSIGRNAYDDDFVAQLLGDFLLEHYPSLLQARYGAPPEAPLLPWLAKRRSFVDVRRAATTLLNDFRTGTLGHITLDI